MRWPAPDEQQDALRRDYVEHLARYDDAMWRSCRAGHLTASSLVVDPQGERVLLTLHPLVGRWLQTGGHCEEGDTDVAAAARREAREESGIAQLVIDGVPLRLDRHEVRCRPSSGEPTRLHHLDVQFLVLADAGAQEKISAESLDLAWWPWDRLPDVDASVEELVRSARERIG